MTGVELGICTDGVIFNLNVLGDGVTRPPQPSGGCSSLSGTKLLSLGTNERVTKFELWINPSDFKWYRMRLTLNSGAAPDYNVIPAGGNYPSYIYNIPADREFTGFFTGTGLANACQITWMTGMTRTPVCTVDLDLTSI